MDRPFSRVAPGAIHSESYFEAIGQLMLTDLGHSLRSLIYHLPK
jgi:hypothetical protein